jgi:hypothetical protein
MQLCLGCGVLVKRMSAVNLKIDWKHELRQCDVPVSIRAKEQLFHRTGTPTRPAQCPTCGSIVYSKRHKLCGLCGCELPEACLFSKQVALTIETMMKTEKERHRAWLRKASTE